MKKLHLDLSTLATPERSPWCKRKHPEKDNDPRGPFRRDRDRILHSDSFRKLQYKTQVFVVHEGDFFRTRLTHSLEVAQIGRTLAYIFNLNEPLIEAICLAHDVGHSPFGHEGEAALKKCLKKSKLVWNANAHSLTVVEETENQYFSYKGLNLTWATREGIARHSTKFDMPVEDGDYIGFKQPSLETQASNIADVIAYCSHDIEDALISHIIDISEIHKLDSPLWHRCYQNATDESSVSGIDNKEQARLLIKRIHRHIIDQLVRDVAKNTQTRYKAKALRTINDIRNMESPLLSFTNETEQDVANLLQFMLDKVYKSPSIDRQNYRASLVITRLFQAFKNDFRLLPFAVQRRINNGSNKILEIAYFIANLTDKSATDLYSELFEPLTRSMGHYID